MNIVIKPDTYARVFITPETASEWLEAGNHRNRNISNELVNRISRAIRKKQWIYNGQPIIFDSRGALIDGQHRLAAIAKSGTTVESLVVSDVTDDRAFITGDDGKKRTLGDNLGALGISHAGTVSSIGNVFYHIYHCRDLSRFKCAGHTVNHLEMVQFVEKIPQIAKSAKMALKTRNLCPVAVMGAALTTFMLINEPMGRDFHEIFTEDLYSFRNHPVKKLKERFINDSVASKSKLNRLDRLSLIFKAWNYWHAGKPVKELIWRSTEKFPVPKGWS